MKIFHTSDLHLGKRLYEYSLIEDQEYILDKIFEYAQKEKPDALIISGDVYDKSIPSIEAVVLFDNFIKKIASLGVSLFIVSGNHDSGERLSFGASLMNQRGVYISEKYCGKTQCISLNDRYGRVNFYLLPFIKPQWVRQFFDNEILSYTDAVRCAVDTMEIDKDERNILITHQFVTGATRSDSEEITVGGTDNVDGEVFSDFDYVALGHLHSPQYVGKENIRYSGTPLKYSFSEERDNKSITVIDLYEKGNFKISTLPLIPIRDLVTVKDKYENLMTKGFYEGKSLTSDYVNIILTDEEEVVDAALKLRTVYKNFMHLEYKNSRSQNSGEILSPERENKTPLEFFNELFKMQNSKEMTPQQSQYFEELALRVAEVNDEA